MWIIGVFFQLSDERSVGLGEGFPRECGDALLTPRRGDCLVIVFGGLGIVWGLFVLAFAGLLLGLLG